jgi:hypothetical protein
MLIDGVATPRYGAIDFFVEEPLQEVNDAFLLDCIGSSWLGGGRGRIDVVPSLGLTSLSNPRDAIGKLARAYLDDERNEGEPRSFLNRTQEFVGRLVGLRRYDAVLVDTRAGLHETTAAAILGLGADVLLFGVDQPQTSIGYRILLSHLAQLPVTNPEHDWRYRLRMVQAKADSAEGVARYRSHMFDVFDETFYSSSDGTGADILDQEFRFGVDDSDAPHFPVPIFEDERYRLFDPVQNHAQLTKELYDASFAAFIHFCLQRLQLEEDPVS